jgi:hypothetical protein
MPTGRATTTASAIDSRVSVNVVGIRSMTRPNAGVRWKKELPKSPRTARPTKRANCTGSGSCRPSAARSTARSASGASGMMSETGSPLACRIAKVTSETPTATTARRTSRRTRNADNRYRLGLASKSQSHSSPRAAYWTRLLMASVSYWVKRKIAGASSRMSVWICE